MGGWLSASTVLHVMLFNKLLKHSFFFPSVFPGNVKILIWIDLSQQLPHFKKEQTRNPSQIPTMPFTTASNPSLCFTQWLIFSVAPVSPSSVNCHFHGKEVADEVRSWYEKVCGGLGSLSSRNEFMILAERKCTLQAVLPTDNRLNSPLGHTIEASKGVWLCFQK